MTADGQPSLPIGSTLGEYQLLRLIAVGGMAEVYLASSDAGGYSRYLALKVIHPELADDASFVQMLVNEAKLAVKLNHPNIVQTYDLGRIGRIYFISMEFVDGADYFQVLRRITEHDQDVPIAAALMVARDMLGGLDYAHNCIDTDGTSLKIIHRDISPQNILLSRRGDVKLVDFGIAKAANLSTKTRAGVIKGKLVYMSPEQSWGNRVDQRTDIFSAGVVLYEALTGGSLYLESNPVKLLQLVRKAEIPPPSTLRLEVDRTLDAIVMRALHPRPEERYQAAREFQEAIADYLARYAPNYSRSMLGELVLSVLTPEELELSLSEIQSSGRLPAALQNSPTPVPLLQQPDLEQSQSLLSGASYQSTSPAGRDNVSQKAQLLLLEDEGTKTYDLGEQFVIGRGGDLRLSDGRVSRRHARIVLHDGSYLVEDLNSSNGTYLNDEKMTDIRRLKHGDRIRIGPFQMQFVITEQAAAPTGTFAQPRPVPPQPGAAAPTYAPAPQPQTGDAVPSHPPAPSSPPPPPPALDRPGGPASALDRPGGPASALDRPGGPASALDKPGGPAGAEQSTPPASANPATPEQGGSTRPLGSRSEARKAVGAADMTARASSPTACMMVKLGDEILTMPVANRLVLGQKLNVGDLPVEGPSSAVVKRGDSYWIEPMPHREAVAINGKPVARATQLTLGDKVQVGPLTLKFAEKRP
jgi:serine/threonine protein kinase